MTISLTYNGDLSRVQIQATALAVAEVSIERSVNGLLWQTVRGGVAIPVQGGQVDLDDFEFTADIENVYRILDTADGSVEEQDSITPSLGGRVWLKSIRYPLLNRPVDVLNWSDIGRGSRSGVFPVVGRSTPIAVHDLRASQEFTLEIVTGDLYDPTVDGLAQARDLDLVLTASGTLFIQVPPDQPIPGGYVTVGDVAEDRVVRHGQPPYVFTLPCTVVTPPGPDVVGTLLTWGTVFDLYGDWNAVLAANPTWRTLLATVGSPDDLVVL